MTPWLPSLLLASQVWIGGDVHLGNHDPTRLLPSVGAPGIVNLEGPVGAGRSSTVTKGAGDGVRRVTLLNHPSAVKKLSKAGVAVCGIANNHDTDAGKTRASTARALEAAGISVAGGAQTARIDNAVITAHDLTHGVPDDLEAQLRRARGGDEFADTTHLIATFHTTGAPSYLPAPELRKAAESAMTAGATLVVGHGSHMIGPVERRGDTVIAWGLGNLVFDCECTNETDGLLLHVTLGPRPGEIDVSIVPIIAGLNGKPARRAGPKESREMFELLEAIGSTDLVAPARGARGPIKLRASTPKPDAPPP